MSETIVKKKSGRPKGAFTSLPKLRNKANEITTRLSPEVRAEFATLMPAEIMLFIARKFLQDENWYDAAVVAEKAAPYYQRKLMDLKVDATLTRETKIIDDNNLDTMINLLEAEWKQS